MKEEDHKEIQNIKTVFVCYLCHDPFHVPEIKRYKIISSPLYYLKGNQTIPLCYLCMRKFKIQGVFLKEEV